MLNTVDQRILEIVADLHSTPRGAFNIRKDGEGISRASTANIQIEVKKDKPGINVIIKPYTINESVHIPVILSRSGIEDLVYNTFEVGEGADVLIVAGCGIHNPGIEKSQHDGVHEFIIHKGAKVRYIEKHYGEGEKGGSKILNPKTIVNLGEGAHAEFELVQIRGVDSTERFTEAKLGNRSHLVVTERILTHGSQFAESKLMIELRGEDATTQVISRAVAQDDSEQIFYPRVAGYASSRGHVQCDAIIMHQARVRSIPEIAAYHADAQLVHEAAIGKIQGEQLMKLMSLGMTEKEAEEVVLQGFLK